MRHKVEIDTSIVHPVDIITAIFTVQNNDAAINIERGITDEFTSGYLTAMAEIGYCASCVMSHSEDPETRIQGKKLGLIATRASFRQMSPA